MASVNELLDLLNCTIRFSATEGKYEGVVKKVFPDSGVVLIGKLTLNDRRMGTLTFQCCELENVKVVNRPNNYVEKSVKNDILPVYAKTSTLKLFDLRGSSDIKDEDNDDDFQTEYKMKLAPRLSKFVPRDFDKIDSFNRDFTFAIKHLRKQTTIGVAVEGIKVSRSGILTWLCISTDSCNFLFDILALGKLAFKKGLKSILENAKIQKVLHDCRLASDCLYHKYNVRLVNVFDTQAADFIVMMQMTEKDKIDSQVNTLDACLKYYLDVPDAYLYGPANLNEDESSLQFHARRPLKHKIQDILIKNIMYLHMLKRELELALLTPLRRVTDVYLNSLQKLKDKELVIVPHKPDELPLDIHSEGIQIFRYGDFEYLCGTTASGPPYRVIRNPIKSYLTHRAEYRNGQREDNNSMFQKHTCQNSFSTSLEANDKSGVGYQKSGGSDVDHSESLTSNVDNHQGVESKCQTHDQKKSTNILIGHNSIDKDVGSHRNESIKVKYSLPDGLRRHLANYGNRYTTVDGSSLASRNNSESSKEANSVRSVIRNSPDTGKSSNIKSDFNIQFNNKMPKAVTCQMHQSSVNGKKSESEVQEMFLKASMKAINISENSANNISTTSKVTNNQSVSEINSVVPKAEVLQIDNSNMKQDVDHSDLEALEAPVKARGAVLRKQKSSVNDCVSQSVLKGGKVQDNLVKEIGNNLKQASKDVTIRYSETLDKPSKFVATVSHKSTKYTCGPIQIIAPRQLALNLIIAMIFGQ